MYHRMNSYMAFQGPNAEDTEPHEGALTKYQGGHRSSLGKRTSQSLKPFGLVALNGAAVRTPGHFSPVGGDLPLQGVCHP